MTNMPSIEMKVLNNRINEIESAIKELPVGNTSRENFIIKLLTLRQLKSEIDITYNKQRDAANAYSTINSITSTNTRT